ncbi:TetR/AcrR family transcriptional regulator [Roseospira visakhapatnamensis]|uniref:TetR/AcrR family transcriptional repressor of nem operon n=1 Tax=Roseospira visakhapatnamensis TaxID=390880 RepID=A0A7W6WA76_9PROT|nr:TetR/AcrR family transcriptional regulator [Roseospira visakhapatnamensis]MBB4266915.1 TetR/AcrR family transcriptional repressor of nem operon [Roseospira visakhapatnamensis]
MGRPREFDEAQALERAMDAFWRHGYAGTSLPDLLTAMDIGRSSFYETFGSKRAAFEAALELYDARVTGRVRDALNAPGPVRAVVEGVLSELVTRALSGEVRGCMVGNTAVELAPHDPAIRARLAASMAGVEDAFAKRLTIARDAGELAPETDPRALARTFLSVIHGVRVVAKARPEKEVLEDITRTALGMLGTDPTGRTDPPPAHSPFP